MTSNIFVLAKYQLIQDEHTKKVDYKNSNGIQRHSTIRNAVVTSRPNHVAKIC